jgi:hypothetical protein
MLLPLDGAARRGTASYFYAATLVIAAAHAAADQTEPAF